MRKKSKKRVKVKVDVVVVVQMVVDRVGLVPIVTPGNDELYNYNPLLSPLSHSHLTLFPLSYNYGGY